jgi:hypothetical protein
MSDRNYKYLSNLASKLQGIAGYISFDAVGKDYPLETKHALLEAAHALDSNAIRIIKKRDGLVMANARGKERLMTWRERCALWLLNGKTEIRP